MRVNLITSRTIYILKSEKNTKFFVRSLLEIDLATLWMSSNYILFFP